MLHFDLKHPQMTQEHLGFIPHFLSALDPRPAREQIDSAYQHGGGWRPFEGFLMYQDGSIQFPGDPAHRVLAEARLGDEIIRYYQHSWVAIVQPDGTFEIARLD